MWTKTATMRTIRNLCLLSGFILTALPMQAGSIVYNMPIRRSTLLYPYYNCGTDRRSWFSLTGFGFGRRDCEDGGKENDRMGGLIVSGRDFYLDDHLWLELKTAFAYEKVTREETSSEGSSTHEDHCDRFGVDDVLISLGYDIFATREKYFSLYGLVGAPTHRQHTIEKPVLVGTGAVTLGGGADMEGEYFSFPHGGLSLFIHPRVLYQFPYSAHSEDMKETNFKVHPGYFADILVGNKVTFCGHSVEIGYDPLIPFGRKVIEDHEEETRFKSAVRHTVYAAYTFATDGTKRSSFAITTGLSYGTVGTRDSRTITGWVTLNFLF